ncbi:MAG: glycosyltransferase family 39 protein [Anaerolineae bacterium]
MLSALRNQVTRLQASIPWDSALARARAAYARHRLAWLAATLLVGVTLAALAQVQFERNRLDWYWNDWQAPAAVGLVGLVVFGLTTQHVAVETPWRDAPAVAWGRLLPPLVAGVFIAAASVPWFKANTFRLPGLALLAAGVALVLLALARESPARRAVRARIASRGLAWEWVALAAIVALGAALRLYHLDQIPGELTLDQISKYWDVRDVLLGKRAPIFFEANQGREALFFYLIALVSQFTGLGFMALKLSSALAGIAAIPALYLLGRELGGRELGAVAATLLAVSKWHIILSRLGYRAVLAPLFVILVLYFLARALRRGRLVDYGWTGVMLGLGMYTYKSFPFALPAAVSCTLLYGLRRRPRALAGTPVMLLLALLVFIPNAVYAVESWDTFFYREELQKELLAEHYANNDLTPAEGYLINVRKTALMDNFLADPIEIYNPSHERFFGPVSAALLIMGLGYLLSRVTEGRNALPLIFLLWLIQPVVLSMFAPYEYANALRAAPTLGPGLIVAAVSLPVLRRYLSDMVTEHVRPLELALYRGAAPAGPQAGAQPADAPPPDAPVRHIRLQPARLLNVVLVLGIVAALGLETRENVRSVFERYPEGLPHGGYPLARVIAGEIADWVGVAPVFIKYTPQALDVGLIKVHLDTRGLSQYWDPDNPSTPGGFQIDTQALDEPPLSRVDLPAAVYILYPPDVPDGLEPLKQRYPAHLIQRHELPDGELGYVVFIGHE